MNLEDSIVGMVAFAMGVLAILARKPMASYILGQQNELWGIRLGPRSEARAATVLLVAGVLVAASGIAVLAWSSLV